MSGSWLRRFAEPVDAVARVVCFPHAGGTVQVFQPLARALTPAVDVVAVQYPGRHDRLREDAHTDVATLAAASAGAIAEDPTDLPVLYLGHSMGALVAFEAARRAVRVPDALVASACRAPTRSHVDPARLESDDALLEEVLTLGATSRAVAENEELRAMVLPSLRADYAALAGYRAAPTDTVDVPLLAVVAEDDHRVGADDAAGWAAHTTGGFTLETVPGDHFYLVPHAVALAGRLRSLASASARDAA